ncbi:MAG TPA: peptidylprolyl isomerase [Terriglobales bacterium]
MKNLLVVSMVAVLAAGAAAQIASHAPTGGGAMAAAAGPSNVAAANPSPTNFSAPAPMASPLQVSDKPVAKVNGAVLTDRDLLREMYSIFPYARQHNGFPKAQEAAIRQGALEMIVFEELVYQEAERRKLTVPAATVNKAEAEFRKQFHSPDEYQAYMNAEMKGSEKQLELQIRRSLLIEQVLKTDVEDKSSVSLAEVRAYYDKNGTKYALPESYAFQSISVIPALKPTAQQAADAQKKAQDLLKQAKATKNYEDFGLLAEKSSEDDFRVNMGDHKVVPKDKLPPQIVAAFAKMQAGQVSGLIQIESAYTIVRLNAHNPARKQPFEEVKGDLRTQLQKEKYEKLRSGLAKSLRARAKVEIV